MKPKILIFDFDGVICDSVHVKTSAFIELYKQYGESVQDEVKKYHLKYGGISRYEKIKYFQSELLGLNTTDETVNEIAKQFSNLVKEKVITSPFINGAKEFIQKQSLNFSQYICTGTPELEMIEIINRRGLKKFFTEVYGSPRTKIEIIYKILKDSKLSPNNCLFFGDSLTDYMAAKKCSVNFIGIQNNETCFPDGTILVKDFTELDKRFI